MPALNDDQFEGLARRLDKPDSGYSINTHTGVEPKHGLMVSQPGGNRKISIPASGGALKGHAVTHDEELGEHDKVQGLWRPGERKTADADISQRFPQHKKKAAMQEMVMNKEEALYDLDKDNGPNEEKGGDIKNVLHPENSTIGTTRNQRGAAKNASRDALDFYSKGLRAKAGRPTLKVERQDRLDREKKAQEE
jgi:hypothetical protein